MTQGLEIRVVPIRGGSEPAVRKLKQLLKKVKNPTQANREVSVWLMRWVALNFRSEGGKVGGWLPFKHGGRVTATGVDESAKLLQDTGVLRASFTPFYSRTIAGIGSGLHYSVTHELGLPHRNVPVRRMLPLASDKDVEQGIIKIYDRWIKRILR